jgi:hypothetical protein
MLFSVGDCGFFVPCSALQPSSEEDLVADLLQQLPSPCVISNRRPDLQASTVSSVNLNGRLLTGLNLYDVLVSGRSRRVVLSSKSKRTGYRDSLQCSKLKLGTLHFDARWAEAGAFETSTRPSRCLNHRSHGLASFPMERCSGRGGYKDPEAPLSTELFLQLLSIYIL